MTAAAIAILRKQAAMLTSGRRPLDSLHIRLLSMTLEGLGVSRERRTETINSAVERSRALKEERRAEREGVANAPP